MTEDTADRRAEKQTEAKKPASLADEEIDKVQGGASASGSPAAQINKGKTVDKTEQGFVSIGGWDNHSG